MSSATYEQPNSDIPLKDSIPTMEDFYNDEFDIERAIKKTPSIEFIFILSEKESCVFLETVKSHSSKETDKCFLQTIFVILILDFTVFMT